MIILKRLRAENFKLLGRVDILFPSQGAVLVEGLNESGKSTLFESVFYAIYGTPLVTEGRGRGNLDSVIRYGDDTMSVELVVEVDETKLEIRRTVKRGRATQAKLTVRRPGAPEEQVTGVLAVNARVVEELGGLDGEALLNSCFVEQKKLSKLEDLGAGQRRDSLRKLLNLDKLTALAERFRVTPQDERALAEANARLELAEVAADLPSVAAERSTLETVLQGDVVSSNSGAVSKRARDLDAISDDGEDGDAAVAGLPWGEPAHLAVASTSRERAQREGPRAAPPRPIGRQGPDRAAGHGRAESDTASTTSKDGLDAGASDNGWQTSAARLGELRSTVHEGRRRATVFAIVALGLLVVTLGLYLTGLPAISWGLPIVLVFALLAWRSYARSRDLGREIPPIEAELSVHRDEMVKRTGELEGLRVRAEESLGVDATGLDVEECRREVEQLSRQIAVKRQAAAIVEGTMERIVRMVLPNTERNLGQILPILTAGRYHEARIGDDYQVQVWDDSAGRYVSKSVFSGGARDQFSLALRLAFALATLPEELGTTPGFIFLDEPLSSFDSPRTEALVRLLTEGQVASSFSQIFVISHNRSFDANAFQYRLVLRDGRVVESNLGAETGYPG